MTDIEVLLQQVANVLDMRNKVSKVSGDDFNIFSVLDMETDEVKTHTRLIYELLRPDGQHGMGKAFIEEFFRIVLPLSKAGLASIGLMFAVTYWNDYTNYKLYITNQDLFNFQMKLRSIIMGSDLPTASGGATENTVKNAAIIIAILPFMIVYPFLQKYFVKGINIGAVKE